MHQAALNLTPSAKTVQHRSNIICRGEAAGVYVWHKSIQRRERW